MSDERLEHFLNSEVPDTRPTASSDLVAALRQTCTSGIFLGTGKTLTETAADRILVLEADKAALARTLEIVRGRLDHRTAKFECETIDATLAKHGGSHD